MWIFEHAYYINLDSRQDRKLLLEAELSTMGIEAERFPAIRHQQGVIGCALSHVACLRDALEKGYDRVLILEDDATFKWNAERLKSTLESVLEKHADFNLLLLDYVDSHSRPVDALVREASRPFNTSAYIVSKSGLPRLLACFESATEKQPIDTAWWSLFGKNSRCFLLIGRPVKQRPGYSDIKKRIDRHNN